METKDIVMIHDCPEVHPFTVENRGDGWYLYKGDDRGANTINFCPYCGKKLSVANLT